MVVETERLSAALGGDREALGKILVTCSAELRLHLARRLGRTYQSALSIDDVLQVTYIEAFLHNSALRERTFEGFLGWLKTVADNNLKDALRALDAGRRLPRKKQSSLNFEESAANFLMELSGSATRPSHGARMAEFVELLGQRMSELPPDYAKAIRLYDLEERSIEEVCQAFDPPRSEGAIHMLRARARDQLRGILGDTSHFFSGSA